MYEMAGIIILGIFAQWLAWRIRVPAILPLILIGLAVGPISTLYTPDGTKLLEPVYQPELDKGLFPNQYLFYFVSLAIGIILFEGGLTLKRKELRGMAPAIGRLISLGAVVTFLGGGLAAYFIMGLSAPLSFLFAALIIVTGPTVIAPILQNVPLNRKVATILKWEGILIDPIGALVAVLVFDFIVSGHGAMAFTSHALLAFVYIMVTGAVVGGLAALFLFQFIKRHWVPHYLTNVFTLAVVLLAFVLSEYFAHESGLLTVVVMGTVLANLDVPQLKEIQFFKESISVLLISMLFILLAANIDMDQLELLKDWRCVALFLFVILLLRPAAVFLSTRGSELSFREKLFIAWVGPRGIVAAGIASLFGLSLTNDGIPGAEYLTPLVFMIVLGTVLLNATTARLVANLLGVTQQASNGILLVGANKAARLIAKYLQDNGRHVVLVDSNEKNVERAREMGLEAIKANIFTDDLEEQFELVDVGYLVALTSNPDVNEFAVTRYKKVFGENGTFRLLTSEELRKDPSELPDTGIFSYTDDYLNFNEVARDYPHIHEVPVRSVEELRQLIRQMSLIDFRLPLFIKFPDGFIDIIPRDLDQLQIEGDGYYLVYMGKPLDTAPRQEARPEPATEHE
ncbi:MAG: cell shape-determining protein [Bacteroidetes bacterium]|nr:MAG: cell shape-determining protein [Bacteroidota bacterium]